MNTVFSPSKNHLPPSVVWSGKSLFFFFFFFFSVSPWFLCKSNNSNLSPLPHLPLSVPFSLLPITFSLRSGAVPGSTPSRTGSAVLRFPKSHALLPDPFSDPPGPRKLRPGSFAMKKETASLRRSSTTCRRTARCIGRRWRWWSAPCSLPSPDWSISWAILSRLRFVFWLSKKGSFSIQLIEPTIKWLFFKSCCVFWAILWELWWVVLNWKMGQFSMLANRIVEVK